ncbi:hypothetical protein NHX12_001848 [Muraenolepis orangiensis]|uniref:Fasciculation and elongation protein zeta-2 n=1 Tax=Muraenolepis orangiensis TaxID=630683 RepID=A0A9Q0E5D1_9TELE|nr:hypothetical protein NHX12_001848 [Muraenolepis orangiensis]
MLTGVRRPSGCSLITGTGRPLARADCMAALCSLVPLDVDVERHEDPFDPPGLSDHEPLLKRDVTAKSGAEDAPGVSYGGFPYGGFQSVNHHGDGVLTQFFPNDEEVDPPVGVITEDPLLSGDPVWNTLTHSYGWVTALHWKRSRTHSRYTADLGWTRQRESDLTTERSGVEEEEEEEEELREQLDMHSIIVPCLNQEPLFTAEQVIEELEEMIEDFLDMEPLPLENHSYQEILGSMNVAELNEVLGETEASILRFSGELVRELDLREEMDFEKEVKNGFISVLIDVQNRQKEHRESVRRRKKLRTPQNRPQTTRGSRFSVEGLTSVFQNGFRQTFGGSGCDDAQYLTTVIPYERRGDAPSIQELQVLTSILKAMKDDGEKVPSLLTDYILKVLCPT